MFGWTQEVPDFARPVQPVQPVQPKIKIGKRTSLFSAAGALERRRVSAHKTCREGVDSLATLDRSNNDGHFSSPTSARKAGRVTPGLDKLHLLSSGSSAGSHSKSGASMYRAN